MSMKILIYDYNANILVNSSLLFYIDLWDFLNRFTDATGRAPGGGAGYSAAASSSPASTFKNVGYEYVQSKIESDHPGAFHSGVLRNHAAAA
jgi:hypothetical protein